MNFSKSFIHYSKVFQSGPTNEANVLIEIKYDVGKTTAGPPRTMGRTATHSQIWLKNVQKVSPFAYAPIERHLTPLLTCRLFPRVPYALLEVCQALLFHTIT